MFSSHCMVRNKGSTRRTSSRLSLWSWTNLQNMDCHKNGLRGIGNHGRLMKPQLCMNCCLTPVATGEKPWNARPKGELLWLQICCSAWIYVIFHMRNEYTWNTYPVYLHCMIKVAAALLAVLKPCKRRARPTCRGTRKSTCDQEPPPAASGDHSSTPSSSDPVNVVDDDDVEIITPPDEGTIFMYVVFILHAWEKYRRSPFIVILNFQSGCPGFARRCCRILWPEKRGSGSATLRIFSPSDPDSINLLEHLHLNSYGGRRI